MPKEEIRCDHRTIGIESTLKLGRCTVCGKSYEEIEPKEEKPEWEECGYCKKVQKNRGNNTGYRCKKHRQKLTMKKVKLYTEEQVRSLLKQEKVKLLEQMLKRGG